MKLFTTKHSLKWLLLLLLIGIATAGAMGYLDPANELLKKEELALNVADHQITLYDIAKGALVLVIIFWVAAIIIDLLEHRIHKIQSLRSAIRMLLVKLAQIIIYFLAFLLAMDFMGIDLTALTIFSGALGIGLGFGLQKIASNFMSGLILLFEQSVEQDDLIELSDGTFGFIRHMGARFTLIETFDGKEIMVPNEDFITSRVINWTYTTKQGRIEIPIGVSYKSDIKRAKEIMLQAAQEHPRCSKAQEPVCYLREYGDSSVNFLLFFWVDDVTEGRFEPQSDVMLAIWDKFHEENIEIPFPQRDLHIPDLKEFLESTTGKKAKTSPKAKK